MEPTVCNECGHSFTEHLIEIQLPSGAVQQQFSCPKCRRVYPVARISKRGVDLRTRLNQLRNDGRGSRADREFRLTLNDFQREFVSLRDS